MKTRRVMRAIAVVLILSGLLLAAYAFWQFNNPVIVVEWSTASEFDVAGFNLYRSDSENGSFEPVNTELIPPADDPLSGGEYAYPDRDVNANTVYYYNLEEVDSSGAKTFYGPIVAESKPGGIWEGLIALWMIVGGVWAWIAAGKTPAKHEQPAESAQE